MKHSHYRPIIRRAWDFSRKNPIFLIAGFFGAFLGNGDVVDVVSKNMFFWDQDWSVMKAIGENIVAALSFSSFWGSIGGVIWVTAAVFFLWLAVASYGTVVVGSSVFRGKKQVPFSSSWQQGRSVSGSLLVVLIVGKSVTYLLFFALYFFLFPSFLNGGIIRFALSTVFLVALILIQWGVAVWVRFGALFVVIEGKSVGMALREGWRILRRHWLPSVELFVLLFAINIAVAVGLVFAILVFSALLAVVIFSSSVAYSLSFLYFTAGMFIAGVAIITAVIGSFFSVFQTSVWTFFFEEVRGKKFTAKVMRLFGGNR